MPIALFFDEPLRKLLLQLPNPLAFCRRNRDDVDLGKFLAQRLKIFFGTDQIHFVRDHKPRTLREQRIVKIEFLAQLLQVFDWIAVFGPRDVDNEQENSSTSDVSQKLVAESEAAMRPFDQTGNVSDRRASVSRKFYRSDDRMQRRERIGGDFRSSSRNFSQQSRFASGRITDQSRICDRS